MRRRIISLTIFSFFTINSLFMTARANKDTPKTNTAIASAPEAKSYDPAKAAARASANATVESELQQLRDLVQTQSEELRELTARLATMEAKVRAAKSTSTSTTAAPADGGVGATPAVTHPSLISRPPLACVGFGFPGSEKSSNRALQESTIGVIPTLCSNPNYGKVQIITQYSYLVRSPWSIPAAAAGPNPKNAHLSMVYVVFRYTLPSDVHGL
jgi:hypothetical protein